MKKLLFVTAVLLVSVGFVLVGSGVGGLIFTYKSVVAENIVTTSDASIPSTPVRGPRTLKSQADIIRIHTLTTTDGKTFAEMPRQIPKLDEDGVLILDEDGKPVMVTNTIRSVWFNATSLIAALNLAIIAYAFSAFVLLIGVIFIWIGFVLNVVRRK